MGIIIIDDHAGLAQLIGKALAQATDSIFLGYANTATSGIKLIEDFKPDVVVVDLSLDKSNGLELLRHFSDLEDSPALVVHTGSTDPADIHAAIEAGASAYVAKASDFSILINAVNQAKQGKQFLCPNTQHQLNIFKEY